MVQKNKSVLNPPADSNDWFAPVVSVSGSVSSCLNSVLENLDAKSKFVAALKSKIGDVSEGGIDRLSALGQSIKMLESTIRFRITLLQPDRKGPWFRTSVASTGPFSGTILHEPVFETYADEDAPNIRKKIVQCWANRDLKDFPFTGKTIWGVLLTHLVALNEINELVAGITIENCLEQLPPELESRYLRAFLMNVRAEYLATKERLEDCYAKLLSMSEKFWDLQVVEQKSQKKTSATQFENPAKKIRDDFRKRREQPRPVIRTTADLEALKFMGFDNYPTLDDLKRQYLNLAKTMHPDRNGGIDEDFKVLTRSYELLLLRAK